MHGGHVYAQSDGPGPGAETPCLLPLNDEPSREVPASRGDEAPPADERLRVLVIDDNQDAADTLAELLALSDHDVEVAYSGPAGLAAAQRFQPEVVLCDLGLPGMDGFAVATTLRATPETRSAHLIAVSGYGQEEDRRRSREAGFELHLTKPVDPAAIERILTHMRS